MIKQFGIVFLFLLTCIACGQKNKRVAVEDPATVSLDVELMHYWDDFQFSDTIAIQDPDVGQKAIVDFIASLSSVSDTMRVKAIGRMLSKANVNSESFNVFFTELERYLYDPNSPVRNDSYYQVALEYALDSIQMDAPEKIRRETRLELVRKNQVGAMALDFSFESAKGEPGSLYNVEAPYLLLFFYEPGCSHCEDAIDKLSHNPRFKDLIAQHKLEVLAVYPFGNEILWNEYQSEIPESWINVINKDSQVIVDNLYDLKATPTIYLLNQDKEVLLKDSDLVNVVLFLGTNRI